MGLILLAGIEGDLLSQVAVSTGSTVVFINVRCEHTLPNDLGKCGHTLPTKDTEPLATGKGSV